MSGFINTLQYIPLFQLIKCFKNITELFGNRQSCFGQAFRRGGGLSNRVPRSPSSCKARLELWRIVWHMGPIICAPSPDVQEIT